MHILAFEINLVNTMPAMSFREFGFTLTINDVTTGRTVNRNRLVPNRLRCSQWIEVINAHLFDYCAERKFTLTRRVRATRMRGSASSRKTGIASAGVSPTSIVTPRPSPLS